MATSLFSSTHHDRHTSPLARLAGCAVILALLVGNASLNAAIAGTTCRVLVIPPTVRLSDSRPGGWFYSLVFGQLGGGALNDYATLELYSPDKGIFDLGTADNLNYSTCNQCVLLRQDAMDDPSDKRFFQDRGTLELPTAPGADHMPVVFYNLRLVEVTIDELNGFVSTPVAGGECYVGDGIFGNGFEH